MDNEFKASSENWQEYVEEYSYQSGFFGYLDATEEMITTLEKLQCLEFSELKAEITEILKERRLFVEHALENVP